MNLWSHRFSQNTNENLSRFLLSLKVGKFQKQIILSSHSPKSQRNFSHFSALVSKKSWKIVQAQDESTNILIWCYLTQWNYFIALIRPLLKARAKNVKNLVGFLGNEKTRLFAFEIYWPLFTPAFGFSDLPMALRGELNSDHWVDTLTIRSKVEQ